MQALSNSQSADLMRQLHPSRLRFAAFSDRNPAMQPVKALADAVRADRKPVSADNPLHMMEQVASTWITTCWESYRLARDAMTEAMFLGTYGSPVLQAMVGQATPEAPTQRRIERDLAREAIAARAQADLEKRFEVGGLAEAVIRAIMHVRLPERTVDERGFAVLQAIRRLQPANRRRSLGEIKTMFRDQYMLLRLDEERAVRAIPRLLPDDAERRAAGWKAVTDVLAASGALPAEGRRRLERLRGAVRRPGPPIDEGDGSLPDVATAATRHEKYERLVKVAAKHPPMATAVAHPCDAASLEGAVEAARMGLLQPILVGPPARIREVAAKASLDIGAFELVELPAQPRLGRQGRRAGARRTGRSPDEGQPAYRRADGRRRGARYRHPHRPPHQPLLRHGRAGPFPGPDHLRRRREHRADARGEGRHRAERDRPCAGALAPSRCAWRS